MSGRPAPLCVAAIALAVLAGACSDGAVEAPTVTSSAIDQPSTVVSVPTTTATATTTTATTTTTTSTTAPPTTVDELEAIETAIKESRLAGEQVFRAAAEDPSNEDLRAQLMSHYTGMSLAATLEILDDLVRSGFVGRPHESIAAGVTFEGSVDLPAGADSTQAFLVECRIDSGVIVEPGVGPNGSDAVVDDDVVAYRTRVHYLLEEGKWKSESGERLGEWTDIAACPSE